MIPGLEIGRRFHLDLHTRWRDKVIGIPFDTNAGSKPKRARNYIFGEDTARRVADKIRGRPPPEIEECLIKGLIARVEMFIAGLGGNYKRRVTVSLDYLAIHS